jgi:chromosome segregation ATPase
MKETPTKSNGNGIINSIEVLAERIANLSKRLDEQAASQQAAVAAALVTSETAITVALANQKETVNAAFAASEKAISKAEESQKEYNKTIGTLQNDVVGLKESRSQSAGNSGGVQNAWGWVVAGLMLLTSLAEAFFIARR